ncbi:MAG TPA: Fe-S cluster assembly protein SufD, partial [Enterovirga sp.]
MNVETPRIRTAAETGLADVFASAKARLPGGRDVATRREAAFRRFEAAGLPHRRIEAWKYTDLRALMRDAKPLAGAPRAEKQALADILPGIEAHRIAIVNGAYVPALSDAKNMDPGIALVELFAWLGDQLSARQDQIADEQDIALSLNAAFMTVGVVLRVRKGARV